MANRAKLANKYNHDFQVAVNKWKKSILFYKGKIELCNQRIKQLEKIKKEHPEEADACQDAINDFIEARRGFIEARTMTIKHMSKRKKMKNRSRKGV